MQIALLFILWLVYLFWGWSDGVKHNAKYSSGGETRGRLFFLVAFSVFITMYVALVFLGSAEGRPWQNPDTAFTAMVITAALLFTSIKLLQPTFYAAFMEVENFETGDYISKKIDTLTIKQGKLWPIFVTIDNTSTVTWDNFRVAVNLPEKFYVVQEDLNEFPKCREWNFASEAGNLRIGRTPSVYVQKIITTPFTIGDTLVLRFFINANRNGDFKLNVTVTCGGRIGEKSESLHLIVEK